MSYQNEVHENLVLYITPEKFYIEAQVSPREVVIIDRVSQEIHLEATHTQIPQTASSKPICGIIGTIRLLAGPYLAVITRRTNVGEINGQPIWRIDETEVISYSRTLLHLTERQAQDNKIYLSMVEQVLSTPYFYFSYSYDLSHTLQRLHHTDPDFLQIPLHGRGDQRFIWNAHLLRPFASHRELRRYCLPIIHGFVSINVCNLNGKVFTWALVSRRSCHRAGTRLFMRGIDSEGSVANYVETEQIIEYQGDRSSFVQTRGSIPLYWSQRPNLKYKPRPQVSTNENHSEAFRRHFDNQVLNYNGQVLINLIDQKGAEGKLETLYANMTSMNSITNVRYEAFDFHHECRKMRWDRLSILINRLAHELDEFVYFLMLRDGTIVSRQEGVFRTNCIDCLDRTNVVQSLLARRNLQNVLTKLQILRPGQLVETQVVFELRFKNVWADHADIISIQYSGTPALKTDFTRTGKRSIWGAMRDGKNSLIRYFKNNFADGFRQDGIDLFLGNYTVEEGEGTLHPCPLEAKRDWKYLLLPLILLVAMAMWFFTVIIPAEYTTETLFYMLFWGAMVAATFILITIYGTEFVDHPKLCETRKKTN